MVNILDFMSHTLPRLWKSALEIEHEELILCNTMCVAAHLH